VVQDVRGDVLACHGWAGLGRDVGVLGNQAFDRIAAEVGVATSGKERVGSGTAAFGQPLTKPLDQLRPVSRLTTPRPIW
jgi:hypothetical protein